MNLPEFSDTSHSTPIKLHTAANPIHSRSNHHAGAPFKVNVILTCIVRKVQVICKRRVFCGYCVNLLYKWRQSKMLTNFSHCNFSAENQPEKKVNLGICMKRTVQNHGSHSFDKTKFKFYSRTNNCFKH